MPTKQMIENSFVDVAPPVQMGSQNTRRGLLRAKLIEAALFINANTQDSREKSLCLTHLQNVWHHAIDAIYINETEAAAGRKVVTNYGGEPAEASGMTGGAAG